MSNDQCRMAGGRGVRFGKRRVKPGARGGVTRGRLPSGAAPASLTVFFLMKSLVRFVLTLGAALAAGGASAAVDLQTLIDRSPFAPPGQASGPAAPAEQQGTLEFRGVVTDEAGTAYSIFDASTNKGSWVRAEDAESPIKVRGYDAANGVLEIEQNGQSVQLSLKRATIQAGAPVVMNGPPSGAPGVGPQMRRDNSADSRRLEAVAAEVRRRRALRNASRAQQGQPPAEQAPAAQ